MKDPLQGRDPLLVVAILSTIYPDDPDLEHDPAPYPWVDLVDEFDIVGARHKRKTIENVLYDLLQFGALHRTGHPPDRRRSDTRAVRPTVLGRAWLDQIVLPLPTDPPDQTGDLEP